MTDQTFRTNETEATAEEINELDNKGETEVTKKLTLRERVFKVCNSFESEGKKITRDSVRACTGGSNRDLSKYLKEWHKSKNNNQSDDNEDNSKGALVVQTSSNVEKKLNSNMVQQEEVQAIKAGIVKQQKKSPASVTMTAAKRAAEVLIAEEKSFQYLLENPDQLPEELKQEVAKAISESDKLMSERSTRFEISFSTEMILSIFHPKV